MISLQTKNPKRLPFLTVVIPAHNEEKRIGPTLEAYASFFQEVTQRKEIQDFEILVVLNACKDNTLQVVKNAAHRYPEIRWLDFVQGGKGFAVIQGFKNARGDLIGFIDADMSNPPKSYYDLVTHIGDHDGIIANRWSQHSIIKTRQPFSRIITSRVFNILVRGFLLMPYRDTQCGCKIFQRVALLSTLQKLEITRWAFDIDLLYKLRKNGFSVIDFPTIWEDREESRVKTVKISLQMFSALVRLRLVYSPFKFIIRFYDLLPESIKFHH